MPPKTSAPDVEKKKSGAKTPHFLSLNQDIVAGLQDEKCGLKYIIYIPRGQPSLEPKMTKGKPGQPLGFHAIRHHVSGVLNDSGKASMQQIQRLLRHRRQSTTENYLHSIEGSLYQAARILDGNVAHSGTPKREGKSKKTQN